jgi:hypothetical protein
MDLLEVGGGGMDWFAVAQDRDRWRVLVHGVRGPSVCIKGRESLD